MLTISMIQVRAFGREQTTPLPSAQYIQNNKGVWLPVSADNPVPTRLSGSNVEHILLEKNIEITPGSATDVVAEPFDPEWYPFIFTTFISGKDKVSGFSYDVLLNPRDENKTPLGLTARSTNITNRHNVFIITEPVPFWRVRIENKINENIVISRLYQMKTNHVDFDDKVVSVHKIEEVR